ncbi:MAG: heparan-alpha-glucosaminide N-acetyltransferase domain-containing protein [Promethearchaeota archaeon]
MNRITSLDFLRGLAILFMIEFHIYIYLFPIGITKGTLIILFLGFLAAPLFLIISGFSFILFIIRYKEKIPNKKILYEILKRSIFIFFISTFLKYLFGGFFSLEFNLIYWSIFQVISAAMIMFSWILLINDISKQIFGNICSILLIIVIYLNPVLIPISIYRILFFGSFPLIPWIILFNFGILTGVLFLNLMDYEIKLFYIIIIILSIILLLNSFYFVIFIKYNNYDLFLFSYAFFSFLFLIFYYIIDRIGKEIFIIESVKNWGKLSFSLYYIQFIIIGFFQIIFNLFNIIFLADITLFILILIISIIFIEILLRTWKKINYLFSLEWLLHKISKKSLFL